METMLMHNPISFNNLNSWVPFRLSDQDPIDDYFECIVECEDGDKSCALEFKYWWLITPFFYAIIYSYENIYFRY